MLLLSKIQPFNTTQFLLLFTEEGNLVSEYSTTIEEMPELIKEIDSIYELDKIFISGGMGYSKKIKDSLVNTKFKKADCKIETME